MTNAIQSIKRRIKETNQGHPEIGAKRAAWALVEAKSPAREAKRHGLGQPQLAKVPKGGTTPRHLG